MKTMDYQRPWLSEGDVEGGSRTCRAALDRMVASEGHKRVLLVAGADHGFWREDRIYQDSFVTFWWQVDSHRTASPIETPLPQGEAAQIFELVREASDEARASSDGRSLPDHLVFLADGGPSVERCSGMLWLEISTRLRKLAGY